jgi:cyclic pyranopterin monophosphate synthase
VKIMVEGIIDVSQKPKVIRTAKATGILHLQQISAEKIQSNNVKKGDVLEASTIAAIQAVKETPRIVPHCHPIPLEGCWVNWSWEGNDLRCTVSVKATYSTGVEMEALTGVCAGLLCAWDMVKYLEKDKLGQYPSSKITDILVLEKRKG